MTIKMKTINILAAALFLAGLTACEGELQESVALNVVPQVAAGISMDKDTLVVRTGVPVTFNMTGNPDFITFYSGEPGHKYDFRERTQVAPEDILSSSLIFSVGEQYGNAQTGKNLIAMFVSDSFDGLSKKDFKADSVKVETHKWTPLVEQDQLPQAPGKAQAYTVDMMPYLGRQITFSIRYRGTDNSAAQPRVNFSGMKIENKMKDGTTTTLYASDFGLTALNMLHKHFLADQKGLSGNRAYGTVTNNVSGVWNIKDAGKGNFYIHSSQSKAAPKYAWLVTNPITVNACSPDAGYNIKNTTSALSTYTHTYSKAGLYKATFLAVNGNYKRVEQVIKEVYVRVK